jgi:hypothetical protein
MFWEGRITIEMSPPVPPGLPPSFPVRLAQSNALGNLFDHAAPGEYTVRVLSLAEEAVGGARYERRHPDKAGQAQIRFSALRPRQPPRNL